VIHLTARDGRARRLPSFCSADACNDGGRQRRYLIEIERPDGSVDRQVVVGGSSIDHASQGLEREGLGSVVRVQPLPLFLGVAA
jgi:hypothetical protein